MASSSTGKTSSSLEGDSSTPDAQGNAQHATERQENAPRDEDDQTRRRLRREKELKRRRDENVKTRPGNGPILITSKDGVLTPFGKMSEEERRAVVAAAQAKVIEADRKLISDPAVKEASS